MEEYGIKDGINAYIVNFDCSNINEVAKKMVNVPKFEFNIPQDIYEKILAPSKSTYQKQLNSWWEVEATAKYENTRTSDNDLCKIHNKDRYIPKPGEKWEVPYSRKEKLYHAGFVNVIREIKEEEECTTKSK